MQNRIKNLAISARLFWANTPILQDSSILYVSSLVTAGVGFLSSIIVARVLGPSNFAIIAGYNAIVLTLVGFTDFGLGTGLIKHAAPHLKKDKKKAIPYLKAVFFIEIAIGLFLLIAGLILAPILPKLLNQNGISDTVVRLAVVSASITSTAAYVSAVLASYKKFKLNAVISIIYGSLKLITTLILWKSGALSIQSILALYIFLSIFNGVVGFIVIPKDYLQKVPIKKVKRAAKYIFHFSIWLTISFFMTSILGKLDFFYLFSIKGSETAGVYAAAQQLSQVYTLLLGAIGTVLTTHVSEKIEYQSMKNFLKRMMPVAAGGAVLFILSCAIAPLLITLIFGQKYIAAIGPLQLLIINLALNLVLLPITLLFIPLGKVKIGTFVIILQLLLSLFLYPRLITMFGINGAPLTLICASLVGVIIYPIVLLYYFKKLREGKLETKVS